MNQINPELTASRDEMMQAIKDAGVSDSRVLASIERLPREMFVSEPYYDKAY